MSDAYDKARQRVERLTLARNAIDESLEDALQELRDVAAAEGAQLVGEPRTGRINVGAPPPHRPGPVPTASGFRPRFDPDAVVVGQSGEKSRAK